MPPPPSGPSIPKIQNFLVKTIFQHIFVNTIIQIMYFDRSDEIHYHKIRI